ncbi:MAG: hypothetical protein WC659_00875 [Patescibacteria group bacterium]
MLNIRLRTVLSTAATVTIASVAAVFAVVAATTVGTNVSTTGTMAVTGATTLSADIYSTDGALFNVASTTAFQVENGSGTDVLKVDTTNTGVVITGQATTTVYQWIGSGGTANYLGYSGGELYVQNDAEIDGALYVTGAATHAADIYSTDGALFNVSSTTALEVQNGSGVSVFKVNTATAGVTVTGSSTLTGDIYSTDGALFNVASTTAFQVENGSGTDVLKVDTTNTGVTITGKATSTVALWVGAAGTADNVDLASGDVYIQGDLEVDGTFYPAISSVSGAFTAGGGYGSTGVTLSTDGNIQANGTLTVDGVSTHAADIYSTDGALFNVASTTALLVQNGSGTNILKVDTTNGGVVMTGNATTTVYHWIGAAGTANFLSYTGGDLYVQDDVEIDDKLYVTGNTTLAADIYSTDGALFNVSSTTALEVQNGSGVSVFKVNTATAGVTVTGSSTLTGDIYSTDGALFNVSSTTAFQVENGSGVDVLKVDSTSTGGTTMTGNATSTGNYTVGDGNSTATSTLEIGDADTAACLKLRDVDADAWVYCYVDGTSLVCSANDQCLK